jgi:hypothetical protein
VDRRRLRARVAVVATAAALISMGAFAVVAFVGSGGDGGNSGGIRAFNACITQTRFLGLARHGYGNSFSETIKDRMRHVAVGDVATDRPPSTVGGAAAANGRYVMSTATPLGRDATAIEGCWDRFFPIAPGA